MTTQDDPLGDYLFAQVAKEFAKQFPHGTQQSPLVVRDRPALALSPVPPASAGHPQSQTETAHGVLK